MNTYLKSANKRFEKIKERDYTIAPISLIDCEIIVELYELLKKFGARDVTQILKNYKYLKDEEIRDQLLQANMDLTKELSESENIEEENNPKKKLKFIVLKNEAIRANYIFGFKTEIKYDQDDNFLGRLILNPVDIDATTKPLYGNHVIAVNDEDKFDNLVESLKTQLSRCDITFMED